jgi:RHS repeat-associated protein
METSVAGIDRVFCWSFQEGRAPLTMMIIVFSGMLAICLVARRNCPVPSVAARHSSLRWWRQFVTLASIFAFTFVSTPDAEAQTYNPVFYYYHTDNLGSSNVLTDRSGYRVQLYEYSTFGQTTYTDNTSAFSISNRYTGQIIDDETGLYYYGARYYDPQLGRFIQADTMVPGAINPQNLNRYSYVNNNPLNLADLTGHGGIFGFLKTMFESNIATLTDAKAWEAAGSGALLGFLAGGPYGAAIGAAVGFGFAKFANNAAATTAYMAGAATGYWTGVGIAIVGSVMSLGFGVGSENIWAIASGVLSVGSASVSAAGESDIGGYLGYTALAVSIGGGIDAALTPHGNAPTFNGQEWNGDPVVQQDNSCTNYAYDDPQTHFTNPGDRGGTPFDGNWSPDNLDRDARADGLVPDSKLWPFDRYGYHRVELFRGDITDANGTLFGHDYHWYRQDADDFWSHKPGSTPARFIDSDGHLILDPRAAARVVNLPPSFALPRGGSLNYNLFVGKYWGLNH